MPAEVVTGGGPAEVTLPEAATTNPAGAIVIEHNPIAAPSPPSTPQPPTPTEIREAAEARKKERKRVGKLPDIKRVGEETRPKPIFCFAQDVTAKSLRELYVMLTKKLGKEKAEKLYSRLLRELSSLITYRTFRCELLPNVAKKLEELLKPLRPRVTVEICTRVGPALLVKVENKTLVFAVKGLFRLLHPEQVKVPAD